MPHILKLLSVAIVFLMILSSIAAFLPSSSANESGTLPVQHTASVTSGRPISVPVDAHNAHHSVINTPHMTGAKMLAFLKARHISPKYAYLPDFNAIGNYSVSNGVVSSIYKSYPAPVGIGDFGVRTQSGTPVAYNVTSSSVMGTISANNMSAFNPSLLTPGALSMQLNAIMNNVTIKGNSDNSFWTQNVVLYSSSTHKVTMIDNVWNMSSNSLPKSTFASGNGLTNPSFPNYYYSVGPSLSVTYPFTINLYMNSSVTNGKANVYFNYSVTSSSVTTSGSYDHVVFNSTVSGTSGLTTKAPTYLISGNTLTPLGLPYDAEMILGGPGGGSSTSLYGLSASMGLYTLQNGAYQKVRSAYDVGGDTGETAQGVAVAWKHSNALLTTGPEFVYGMWNASSVSGMSQFTGTVSPSNAFLFVSPGSSFSAETASWVPLPASGKYSFELPTGTYTVNVSLADHTSAVTALGQSEVFNLPVSASAGVYTPLYAMDNTQLASISSSGTGTLTSQYQIYNNTVPVLGSVYNRSNDFGYPVFYGMVLYNTSKYVTASGMDNVNIPINTGLKAPLVYIIIDSSNVSLIKSSLGAFPYWYTHVSSLFPSQTMLSPLNVINATHSLFASNSFSGGGFSDMYVYNGSANYIWGNRIISNESDPAEYGLFLSSSGNTIYNNYFWGLRLNSAYTAVLGFGNTYPSNIWNVSYEPASAASTYNGFTLTGSITGSNYQGGNYWWKYSGITPYSASLGIATTSGQPVQGDYLPLAGAYNVTFNLTSGLPQSFLSNFEVFFNNTMTSLTAGSHSINMYVVNGTYSFSVPYIYEDYAGAIMPPGLAYEPNITGGTTNVNGNALSYNVSFSTDYLLTFSTTGLPSGTEWWVNMSNGMSYESTSSINYAYLTAGTYSYTIATTDKQMHANGGSVNVGTLDQVVQVPFAKETYTLGFYEGGLHQGTSWSVTIGSDTISTTSGSVTFSLVNGTYTANIAASGGYIAVPGTYTVTVSGGNYQFPVGFASSYNETYIKPATTIDTFNNVFSSGYVLNYSSYQDSSYFSGSGLPGPSSIALDTQSNVLFSADSVAGNVSAYNLTTQQLAGRIYLGSTSQPFWTYYDASVNRLFVTTYTGNLTVVNPNTMSVTANISIPQGKDSYVVVQGGNAGQYVYVLNARGNLSKIDASTYTIVKTVSVANGTHLDGNFDVSGGYVYIPESTGNRVFLVSTSTMDTSNISAPKDYNPIRVGTYNSGSELLITGDNYTNLLLNTTTDSFTTIPKINGYVLGSAYDPYNGFVYTDVFSFSINAGLGEIVALNTSSGTMAAEIPGNYEFESMLFDLQAQTVLTANLPFGSITEYTVSPVYYSIQFKETGLASGVEWYVNSSSGQKLSSSGNEITTMVKDGKYSFSVANLSSYYTSDYSVSVSVNGGNVVESIDFLHYAYVTGTATQSGVNITLNGNAVKITGGTFNVTVTQGSYELVATLNGYNTFYDNFSISAGQVKNITVDFKPPTTPKGLSGTELYEIIGGIAGVVIVIGAIAVIRRR